MREVVGSNPTVSTTKYLKRIFVLGIFLSKPQGLVYHHAIGVYIIAVGVYHQAERLHIPFAV